MTQIPLEAGKTLRFTPPSLADTENPPEFRLRVGTRRHKEEMRVRSTEEGAFQYSEQEIRDEMLVALKEGWDQSVFDEKEPLIQSFWTELDAYEKQNKDVPFADRTPFEFALFPAKDYDDLFEQVEASWPKLRQMRAQNEKSGRIYPLIVASVIIEGWSNLDTPFIREGGMISVDTAYDVQQALSPLAWAELFVACAERLDLTKATEKNSQSPVPSSQTPPGSSSGQASTSGPSTEPEPSPPTPEDLSKTSTSTSSEPTGNATAE